MEMSQSSGSGLDCNLSDEILSLIPTDPFDQLDLARKITSMAIASRISNLQSENGKLKQKVYEKDRQTLELQDKVSQLEQAFQDVHLRLKITREDNMKLSKERDSLAMTAKKLGRDLAKLETFKRQLMQSLNEDNSSPTQTVDIMTYDQSVPRAYPVNEEETKTYPTQHSFSGSSESDIIADDVSKQAVQKFSLTPYLSPRLTPTGTPKVFSASVPPRRYSTTVSPQKHLVPQRQSSFNMKGVVHCLPGTHQVNSQPQQTLLAVDVPFQHVLPELMEKNFSVKLGVV